MIRTEGSGLPSYTHRPTQIPGADPDKDRKVLFGDAVIGRTYFVADSPRGPHWAWFSAWSGLVVGHEETLEQALAALKAAHKAR